MTSVQSDYTSTGAPGEIPDGPDFFTDYLSANFVSDYLVNSEALGPGQTFYQGGGSFLADQPQIGTPGVDAVGLASFAISPTADLGYLSAQLHITYDIYDADPFSNQSANYLGSDQVDIDTGVNVVPEPSCASLIALGASESG